MRRGTSAFRSMADGARFWTKKICVRFTAAWGKRLPASPARNIPGLQKSMGPFREISLSASCPAANALLLESREPLKFLERETSEPEEAGDPWLVGLLLLRERMLLILQDRTRPLKERLKEILTLSMDAQPLLDEDRGEELAVMVRTWRMEERKVPAGAGVFPAALHVLASLEVLEPDWAGAAEPV